ncbi:hypothetical protein J6500_08390 [Bradyrhizobium sp. WSM 1704]|uniref:hypothetical protein n=1 Tax=Bradyrhizobium semiaridum TaxID=2821404 RepID=UPI001CE36256|nr:hypothetical protein [Bradyrhizobium semiaridum]MCA6121917.1 hypothetical protein [Bradyrhizobium semiaridum]
MLALISKYEQWRRSNAGGDSKTSSISPDYSPAESKRGQYYEEQPFFDQPDPNIRRLERIDTTAAAKKVPKIESPPLAPDETPPSEPVPDASGAGGVNDEVCAKEWADARKECKEAYNSGVAARNRFLYGWPKGRYALFSEDDCAKIRVREVCGGEKLDHGRTYEERRNSNNAHLQKKKRGKR